LEFGEGGSVEAGGEGAGGGEAAGVGGVLALGEFGGVCAAVFGAWRFGAFGGVFEPVAEGGELVHEGLLVFPATLGHEAVGVEEVGIVRHDLKHAAS
jgi:hypothetical protein